MRAARWIVLLLAGALCALAAWRAANRWPAASSALPGQLQAEDDANPNDSRARFLLLTSRGPLVLEAEITLEGQPFRLPREKLLDDLLAQADADGDGSPTWAEAFANPKFAFGRFTYGAHERQSPREQTIKVFDRDRDGIVDRQEARFLLTQTFGGGVLSVQGYREAAEDAAWKLLDADQDGSLSPGELAAATDMLRELDRDGNESLSEAELAGRDAAFKARVGVENLLLSLHGPDAGKSVQQAFNLRYSHGGRPLAGDVWPLAPGLLAQLDANGDGQIDAQEANRIMSVRPNIQVQLNFSTDGPAQLTVLPPDGGETTSNKLPTAAASIWEMPGLVLRLEVNPATPKADKAAASLTLTQLDGDRNGYVERDELTGDNRQFLTQYDLWDSDGNGKVVVEEILAFQQQQLAPQQTQVGVLASEDEDPAYASLDADGDGLLGLRETLFAAARLLQLDRDGDGRVARSELPHRITVTFGRGPAQFDRRVTIGETQLGAAVSRPHKSRAAWFERMDRNGDGDVSPSEFLGQPAQFMAFDINGDGLLDPQEAESAR